MPKDLWTSADIARLIEACENREPVDKIAKRLKRTPIAIEAKARRLKLKLPC